MLPTTVTKDVGATTPLRQNRDFQLLLTGSSVSMLGSRVSTIAYPLLVLALAGSPVVAGWATFAATAPSILVYLPAGALVDRWDPRGAMVFSEFGRGAAITTVVVMLATGHASVPLLVAVAVIDGILQVFSVLAERRFVRFLVEPDEAASALARTEARTHIVVLAGRPLGGLLFGLGRALPFLADMLSFAVSVFTLLRISKMRQAGRPERASYRHLGREIRQGLRGLHCNPFARMALPLAAGTTLIGQALIMVFLAEAHARHLAPVAVGIVLAASGAGGALGSAAASRLFSCFGYSLLKIQMYTWAGAFAFLALWGGRSFLGVAVAIAITGFAGALGNIALNTYLVRETAETMLARVMSVGSLMSFGGLALGPLLGGVFTGRYGAQAAMVMLFILTAFLAAAAAVAPSTRNPSGLI